MELERDKDKERIGAFVKDVMDRSFFRNDDERSRNLVSNDLEEVYATMKKSSMPSFSSEMKMVVLHTLLLPKFKNPENPLTAGNFKTPLDAAKMLAKQFHTHMEQWKSSVRVRDTEFGIVGTKRIWGQHDMKSLSDHVEELFRWHSDSRARQKYAAPYKPIIQSSGTGKTKLLHDFCRSTTATNKIQCFFISCLPRDTVRGNKMHAYDCYLDTTKPYSLESIMAKLVQDSSPKQILLVFDEAQLLSDGESVGIHILRKFLRRKRNDAHVVALIAGTTTCLANCYPPEARRASSREAENSFDYHESGPFLYGPIFEFFTMGCYAEKIVSPPDATEFERAVPYGRPLFARLLFEETDQFDTNYPVQATSTLTDEELARIATRMLLGTTNPFAPDSRLLPFVSIWATRVQLGCTQAPVVDELVAKGYAHLTGFAIPNDADDGKLPRPTASFSYLADPVCAYLAMQLMNDKWELVAADRTLKGFPQKEWIAKLKQVFSCGVCRPPRGDLGEILCATYLLFCGDCIRFQQTDIRCQTFSIPVDSWVATAESPKAESVGMQPTNAFPRINFLQFCRNDLRFGVSDCCNQHFLAHIYKRCCAMYAYSGCPFFDAVAAAESTAPDGTTFYTPVLMSIKTVGDFTRTKARKEVDSMVNALVENKVKCALVLVILLDSDAKTPTETAEVTQPPAMIPTRSQTTPSRQEISTRSRSLQVHECDKEIVSRVIVIPNGDPFGITDLAWSVTGSDDGQGIYSSQTFIGSMPSENLCGTRKRRNADAEPTSSVLTLGRDVRNGEKLQALWSERMESTPGVETPPDQRMDVS